ncbi:MAG: T9SS type A sorting domain-containing protein [Ignavibacteriaceae bacterium]
MKLLIILLVFSVSSVSFSQEKYVLENRNRTDTHNLQEVKPIKFPPNNKSVQVLKPISTSDEPLSLDTLSYFCLAGQSNFGIFGQDVIIQWFKAPTDLTIKSVGVYCMENNNNTAAELKIVRLNWDENQLISQTQKLHGYYPADGSITGITSFLDSPERTGNWVSIDTNETEPFEHDIWSNSGVGYSFIPNPALLNYQWISMSNLGNEPTIVCGEIFGIAVKNSSVNLDSDRIGFLTTGCLFPRLWKFHANGRLVPGVDKGWWTREFTFDVRVAVDLSNVEYLVDIIHTPLSNTMSTEPRAVNAELIPWYLLTEELVAKVNFSTDGGSTWSITEMEFLGNNQYGGIIPGFPTQTTVQYYISTLDTTLPNGCNQSVSVTYEYSIFGPSGANTLVVLNGYNQTEGYPQDYFFGPDIQSGTASFDHDIWAYGQPPSDLFNNYTNIIEICNGAPEYYLDSLIRPWLAGGSNRNYYLEGQEWLGARYSYVDKNFVAGDFEFDVLGINESFNDVSYNGTTGQTIPSKLIPQAGTLFGQPLIDRFSTYLPIPDSIQYDPNYEVFENNWMDGFFVESDVIVDVISETRGIAGAPSVTDKPCAMHRTLPAGNKIFFASYWNIAVNTTQTNYNWLGFTNESPAYQALVWFGITISDVKQVGSGVPEVYSLSQNYPNPFNPSTKISWQSPVSGNQTLKVYDVLGNEVATLVNEFKNAGMYEVDFDASTLSSGVYFYQLKAGEFLETRKMVLLK